MGDDNQYKQKVAQAYDAVEGLKADEAFKLAGFKAVLNALLGGISTASPLTTPPNGANKQVDKGQAAGDGGWEATIANKLSLTVEQVASIYHLDGDELKIIVDHKKLPKSLSQSTQHLAALVAAGRQALKLDDGRTDYDLIRTVCREYGVYNAKNFTSYVKLLGNRFVYSGSGQSQSISLTLPAFTIASDVAKRYVEGEA